MPENIRLSVYTYSSFPYAPTVPELRIRNTRVELSACLNFNFFEMNGGCTQKPTMDIGSPLFTKMTISLDNNYYKGKELS